MKLLSDGTMPLTPEDIKANCKAVMYGFSIPSDQSDEVLIPMAEGYINYHKERIEQGEVSRNPEWERIQREIAQLTPLELITLYRKARKL